MVSEGYFSIFSERILHSFTTNIVLLRGVRFNSHVPKLHLNPNQLPMHIRFINLAWRTDYTGPLLSSAK